MLINKPNDYAFEPEPERKPATVPDPREVIADSVTVTIAQARVITGLSRTTLYEAVRRGQLRKLRACGRTLIPLSDLRELVGLGGPSAGDT
jgi:hypothetical protein